MSVGHGRDIVYAIGVNCIWGLAFVIPEYLSEVDPALIALGRYFVYGIVSAGILFAASAATELLRVDWLRAFAYAFLGHLGYYLVLVWAISSGGIMVVAPIMATLPVFVAVVGNALDKELDFRRLAFPLLFIGLGITYLRIHQERDFGARGAEMPDMVYGASLAFGALAMWTLYAVLNARYLKRSQVSSALWAQAMGICCLLQVGIAAVLWGLVDDRHPRPLTEWTAQFSIPKFLAGVVILGVLVSWFAAQVWNHVSRRLPITVAGQLLVVQSLAAIAYGSWVGRRPPQLIELICVVVVVVAVIWGVDAAYASRQRT